MSKKLKFKIYAILFFPFVLATIGFTSLVYGINYNKLIPTNYIIFSSLFGLVFWFFETRLLCSIIEKEIKEKKLKNIK
jgi:hypothetical protein